MALIIDDDISANQSSSDFWRDELKNLRIILVAIDKLIFNLSKNPTKSYTLDTGQNSTSVGRQDLPMLIQRRKDIVDQINELESLLGEQVPVSGQLVQVAPSW
jgi:spermidine/putrescine-binding protein